MAKFTKILNDVAKLYDGKVTGNVIKFDSEDTLFKAADEIADQAAYTMDQDKNTIEFIDENIDIKFIGNVCKNVNESYDKNVVGKVMKSLGCVNESIVDSVATQLQRLTSAKKNVDVQPDVMQNLASTITIDTVQSSSIGADGTITLRVGDKLMNVNPVEVVDFNESTYAYFGTTQLNESEYKAVCAIDQPESRRRFLTSMGMNNLDAESVAKNLELLKKNYPEMNDQGLLPINESVEDKFDFHNIAYEKMVQAGKVSDLKSHLNTKGSGIEIDNDTFSKTFTEIPAELKKEVSSYLKDKGFISESVEYLNESKNMDIYNLQSKIALAIHKSGLKGADVLAALLLVTAEAKNGKDNYKAYVNISDNKYINESDEVPVTSLDDIAGEVLLYMKRNNHDGVSGASRNTVKTVIKDLIGTVNLSDKWLETDSIISIIDKVQSFVNENVFANESINSIEHKISNEKEKIQRVKSQAKSQANMNDNKLADAKRSLSYSKSELKAAKKSKEINESEMINESAVAYILPNSAYTNPWLNHCINTNPGLVGIEFGNMYRDSFGVNASVCVVDGIEQSAQSIPVEEIDAPIADITEPRLIYSNDGQLNFGSPVSAEVSPTGIIKTLDQFKLYANEVLNNLGLTNDVDRKSRIDKAIEMNQNNYGAMIYAIHRPIGK